MTTYKLPEIIGGAEVEATEQWSGCAGAQPEYLVGGITITMPVGVLLEQVKPPLPPEPPDDNVVRTPGGHVWQRCDDAAEAATMPTRPWRNEDMGWESWAGVCDYGTPVPLLPAPEPVTLPWAMSDPFSRQRVRVTTSDANFEGDGPSQLSAAWVAAGSEHVGSHINAATAREMAYALLTAADEADRRGDA